MMTKKSEKVVKLFRCDKCDYQCSRKYDFKKHCKTIKHNVDNVDNKTLNICECGKSYKHRQSLSLHKKKCFGAAFVLQKEDKEKSLTLSEMFIKVVEENKELRDMMVEQNQKLMELAEQPKINNNIKTQNNTFNVLNYLNTECADALNLSEMIDQLQITFEDLLVIKNQGFVKSIEHSFVNKLKNMEQNKRPIHCTDKKRKSMYVKEDNKWDRDLQHNKLQKAIIDVNEKQYKTLTNWFKSNPAWNYNETTEDHGLGIMNEIYGFTKDDKGMKNKNKIIHKIIESTVLDKNE